MLAWNKVVSGLADSPYPEDRRPKYVSGEYEITKEGDGNYWLRHSGTPLGFGKTLSRAKEAAEQHCARTS